MNYRIDEIEGIEATFADKLASAGIKTTADLLQQCATAKGRKAVSDKTGLDPKRLLKWVNMADLLRISGVGGELSELLEAAGVDTMKELQRRTAESLWAKMEEVNAEMQLTHRVPNADQVARWIAQAKTLPPIVSP